MPTKGGYDGYIPIPEWDGRQWQPVDMSGEFPGITWPDGINPDDLPKPLYTLGQIVKFRWSKNEIWEGEVRQITLSGGAYYNHNGTAYQVAMRRYFDPNGMSYTIHARGHGRWVKPEQILG